MTYGELKKRLKYMLAGGKATASSEDAVRAYYDEAMNMLLGMTEPLELITQDASRFEKFRPLDNVYFIRRPKAVVDDYSEIELDNDLVDILVNYMAYLMADNPKLGQALFQQAVSKRDIYLNKRFKFLQDTNYYPMRLGGTFKPNETRHDIPIVLEDAGKLKYYMVFRTVGTPDGWTRKWDRSTVDVIDEFMAHIDAINNLNPSQLALINQLFDYEDAEASTDPEAKALKILDEILTARGEGRSDADKCY